MEKCNPHEIHLKSARFLRFNNLIKRIGILLLLIFSGAIWINASAQTRQTDVVGTVMDSQSKEAMPGVNIQIKGTTIQKPDNLTTFRRSKLTTSELVF